MHSTWKNILVIGIVISFVGFVAVWKSQRAETKISTHNYETNGLPLLLEVGSDTCVPCVAMEEVLEELRRDYKNVLHVEFLHAKNTEEVKKLEVHAIPTQIFYNADGNEFFRHVGFFSAQEIVSVFKDHGINLNTSE
jgi:thioredoxin 1